MYFLNTILIFLGCTQLRLISDMIILFYNNDVKYLLLFSIITADMKQADRVYLFERLTFLYLNFISFYIHVALVCNSSFLTLSIVAMLLFPSHIKCQNINVAWNLKTKS